MPISPVDLVYFHLRMGVVNYGATESEMLSTVSPALVPTVTAPLAVLPVFFCPRSCCTPPCRTMRRQNLALYCMKPV